MIEVSDENFISAIDKFMEIFDKIEMEKKIKIDRYSFKLGAMAMARAIQNFAVEDEANGN